ncbi:MAG: hypothetical protein AAB728_02180 [Patescibacteria group bacterium]
MAVPSFQQQHEFIVEQQQLIVFFELAQQHVLEFVVLQFILVIELDEQCVVQLIRQRECGFRSGDGPCVVT